MNNKIFDKKVMQLLNNWKKKYLSECKKNKPIPCNYENKTYVKDQIDFIFQYTIYLKLNGPHKENHELIKHFLSMQVDKNSGTRTKVCFIGGLLVDECEVNLDSINDIDCEDVYRFTEFCEINAYKPKNKKWTKKSAESFIKTVKEDMEYDGGELSYNYSFKGNILEANCDMRD